ncbi:MAG: FMN-binding protein [Firmicutes bacterium]|nr:FMN-binding protein [Bacillota bacterium]
MKKARTISVLTVALVLALSMAAFAWNDGVYVGKANGHNGPITLQVTVEGGKITAIEVLEHKETPFLGDAGFTVIDAIIEAQSTDVDVITGASVTSRAVLAAVKDALGGLTDGTYTGEGRGFKSTISVEVVIEGGKIAAINVLSQDETPVLSDAAFNTIPGAIIEAQSTDVDVVTGATGTSKGIIEAVNNALSK